MFSNFAIFGLSPVFGLITLIVLLIVLIFEILMLISAIQNKHITTDRRVLWIVGMFLIHPFVAIAYYFTDYKKTK